MIRGRHLVALAVGGGGGLGQRLDEDGGLQLLQHRLLPRVLLVEGLLDRRVLRRPGLGRGSHSEPTLVLDEG